MPSSTGPSSEPSSPGNPYSDDVDQQEPEYLPYTEGDTLTGEDLIYIIGRYNWMVDRAHYDRKNAERTSSELTKRDHTLQAVRSLNTELRTQFDVLKQAIAALEEEKRGLEEEKLSLQDEVNKIQDDKNLKQRMIALERRVGVMEKSKKEKPRRSAKLRNTSHATAPTAGGRSASSVPRDVAMSDDHPGNDTRYAEGVRFQESSVRVSTRASKKYGATSVQGYMTSPDDDDRNDGDADDMEVETADLTQSDDDQLSALDTYVADHLKEAGKEREGGRIVVCRGEHIPIDLYGCEALSDLLEAQLDPIFDEADKKYAEKRKDLDSRQENWTTFGRRTAGCVYQYLKMAKTRFAKESNMVACYHCFNAQRPCIRWINEAGFCVAPLPERFRSDSIQDVGYYVYGEEDAGKQMNQIQRLQVWYMS